MTPAEIMAALSVKGPLPREALLAAGRIREQMIQEFLAMIDRLRGAVSTTATDDDLAAFLFVFYLLGEWRDPRTYRPLMGLLRHDQELLDALLGDAITEGTARVVAGVCDGDLEPIFDVAHDANADSFIRAQMFDALVVLALSDPLHRPPVQAFLTNFIASATPNTPSHILSTWAFAIAALGITSLVPDVRRLYDGQQIPPADSDFPYFEQCLRKTLDEGRPAWFERQHNARLIENTIEELSRWHCFSPEFLIRERHLMEEIGDPEAFLANPFQHAVPKIGRNDPCPCGSGKKFKKCCLQ